MLPSALNPTARWLVLAAAIAALDQLTKYLLTLNFAPGESLTLTPFLNLVYVLNPGAAFSFLADQPGWQRGLFIALALVASAWIVFLLVRHPRERVFAAALTLVLAGAVGNLVDRVTIGAVIDFLDFHAAGYHWPAFNVADSAITCGAILLVWDALRSGRKEQRGTMKEGGV